MDAHSKTIYLRCFLILTSVCFTGAGLLPCLGMCSELENEQIAAETSNSTELCKHSSKYVFCLASHTSNCENNETAAEGILANVRTKYYNTCGITESGVSNCTSKVSLQCSAEYQTSIDHIRNREYVKYCQTVASYLQCIQQEISSRCTNGKISATDVVGNRVKTYASNLCVRDNADFQDCYALFYNQCGTFSDCSSIPTLKLCAEQTNCSTAAGTLRVMKMINETYEVPCKRAEVIAQCPGKMAVCSNLIQQASRKVMAGDVPGCEIELAAATSCYNNISGCGDMNPYLEPYKEICLRGECPGKQVVCAKLIQQAGIKVRDGDMPGCESELAAAMSCFNNISGCGDMTNHLESYKGICVNGQCYGKQAVCVKLIQQASKKVKDGDMPGCETQLAVALSCFINISGCGDMTGYGETYKRTCESPEKEICPQMSVCVNSLKTKNSNSVDRTVSGKMLCGSIGTFMDCYIRTMKECGLVSKTMYGFSQLKDSLISSCEFVVNNKLQSCEMFAGCMTNMLASKEFEPMNPEYYCFFGRGMATCAKYSAKSCGLVDDEAIKSKAEDDLSHLNKFCPSADVYIPQCSAADSCKSYFSLPMSNPFGIFQSICKNTPLGLECLTNKAKECKLEGLQSYSYKDLSKGLSDLCTVIQQNAVIASCVQFTQCLQRVQVEKLPTHYTNPKFLCKLLTRAAACASWSAATCLPNNMAAKASLENIMQEWYAKCPKIDLPYSCNSAAYCLQPLAAFKRYTGPSIVDICPKMKKCMGCFNNALRMCSIKQAPTYDFTQLAELFDKTCGILLNPSNVALKECETFDFCVRQIRLPTKSKEATSFPDPRYWCGVVRDVAICSFKSADACNLTRNSELKAATAKLVNTISSKCPADGFEKFKSGLGPTSGGLTTAPLVTVLVSCLLQVLMGRQLAV